MQITPQIPTFGKNEKTSWWLIGPDGKPYLSSKPGTLGGHRKLKIYGKLDCPSAERWLKKGHYAQHRIFFLDENTAKSAGYRPCGVCMRPEYIQWKATQKETSKSKSKKINFIG